MIQPPLNYHSAKRLIIVNDDESIEWDEDGEDGMILGTVLRTGDAVKNVVVVNVNVAEELFSGM